MNRSSGILSRYGALELKRAYRKNLSIGILLAVVMSLAGIGGLFVSGCGKGAPVEAPADTISVITLQPPRPWPPIPPRGPQQDAPDFGTGQVVSVPEDQIDDDGPEVPSQNDIQRMIQQRLINNIDDFGTNPVLINDVDIPPVDSDPGVFISYDEAPIIVENVQPVYPEMARRAGLTGEVWVNVLVGKDGSVKDVRILKCTNEGVGFEEAAVAAAFKNAWKPAISNGQPLAIWTAYKIVFKLK